MAVRSLHQWQGGPPSSMRSLFFLNSAVFLVLGFVLRLGVCFRGAICFQLARPGGLALSLWVVLFHDGFGLVALFYVTSLVVL